MARVWGRRWIGGLAGHEGRGGSPTIFPPEDVRVPPLGEGKSTVVPELPSEVQGSNRR